MLSLTQFRRSIYSQHSRVTYTREIRSLSERGSRSFCCSKCPRKIDRSHTKISHESQARIFVEGCSARIFFQWNMADIGKPVSIWFLDRLGSTSNLCSCTSNFRNFTRTLEPSQKRSQIPRESIIGSPLTRETSSYESKGSTKSGRLTGWGIPRTDRRAARSINLKPPMEVDRSPGAPLINPKHVEAAVRLKFSRLITRSGRMARSRAT